MKKSTTFAILAEMFLVTAFILLSFKVFGTKSIFGYEISTSIDLTSKIVILASFVLYLIMSSISLMLTDKENKEVD